MSTSTTSRIREVMPHESEAEVLASLDTEDHSDEEDSGGLGLGSDEDEIDFSDDGIEDYDDDHLIAKLDVGCDAFIKDSGPAPSGLTCHDSDDYDSECAHCTCDKHKKILSFMDACVKLGFQLLSSDFEKSFKPLLNAFHSNQKTIPIKQLNGVTLSVKRVCNYALEQSAVGYIEKFKKFIQKEMDTDYDHIEFLIEMHFEMRENFDCYCKNFTVLLGIANHLNPAYSDAVSFKVNCKSFKEGQAIDRFLKTQEDIKSALVHYEIVLAEIKEKFELQHPNLRLPDVPEKIRCLMNGSWWVTIEAEKDSTDLESSSEHIDLSKLEIEEEREPVKNMKNKIVVDEKQKKSKKKGGKPEIGNVNAAVAFRSGPKNMDVSDKRLVGVNVTTSNAERGFKVKESSDSLAKKRLAEKFSFGSRDRSESSSRVSSNSSPRPSVVEIDAKLKNSCLRRGFVCCAQKELYDPKAEWKASEKNKPTEKLEEKEEKVLPPVKSIKTKEDPESIFGLRPEDYVDDSDEIGLEDMSEFITVNNKRSSKNKMTNSKNPDSWDGKEFLSKPSFFANEDDRSKSRLFKTEKIPFGAPSTETASTISFPSTGSTQLTISQKLQALTQDRVDKVPEPESSNILPEIGRDGDKQDDATFEVSKITQPPINKPKPISKPIATVDPLKKESAPVVTTSASAKNADPSKWNVGPGYEGSLFSTSSTMINGPSSLLDQPMYQGYSPLNGSDRLRPVQDSMALYTKSNVSSKDTEADSKFHPVAPSINSVSSSSNFVFSAFSESSIYPGIFSQASEGSFPSAAPGFNIKEDLLKASDKFVGTENGMSPEYEVQSNLNPTANIFNPTAASKGFFPSANPPGGLFHRSNSTPENPFENRPPIIGTSNLLTSGTHSRSDPDATGLQSFGTSSSSKRAPAGQVDAQWANCFSKLYREHMHVNVKLVTTELTDCRARLFLLMKLQQLRPNDKEIQEVIMELKSRMDQLKELLDKVYRVSKHNMVLLNYPGVSYEQLTPMSIKVPVLSQQLTKFFSS